MSDITTKFDEFKSNKVDNFEKNDEYQSLSDDIIAISKLDNGEYEKVKGPVEIVQITGVLTDEDEIKKLEEAAGVPAISTDLSLKEVKRGQEIWITALLKILLEVQTINQYIPLITVLTIIKKVKMFSLSQFYFQNVIIF